MDGIDSAGNNLSKIVVAAVFSMLATNACQCEDGLGMLNASVVLEPEQLDFQEVALNSTKVLPLKIWNRGSFVLSVNDFSADTNFIAPTLTTTIGIGQHEDIMVGFKPTELGPYSGNISFKTSDPEAPIVLIPVTGVGIQAAITVDPEVVDFGDVVWKTMSPTPEVKTITISNPGSDDFELSSITVTDDAQGAFKIDPGHMAVNTYAPGHEETVSVSFAPTSKGMHTGTIEIVNNTPSRPNIAVPLMGKAVGPILNVCAKVSGEAELCSQSAEVPKIDFGYVNPEGTAAGTVRIINEGDLPLRIDQTLISGTGSERFFVFTPMIIEDQGFILDPGQEKAWDVVFTPDNYQPGIIFLSFTTNASNNDFSVVTGANSVRIDAKVGKPTIRVSPDNYTLNQGGTNSPVSQRIKIFSCGTYDLVIENISIRQISGPAQAFTLQNVPPAGTSITPQTDCSSPNPTVMQDFQVVFESSAIGSYSAEITITSNDPLLPTVTISAEITKS